MRIPAKQESSKNISIQLAPRSAHAISAWLDEFYSNPLNRKAYADWCAANGLENDLSEEYSVPNWHEV